MVDTDRVGGDHYYTHTKPYKIISFSLINQNIDFIFTRNLLILFSSMLYSYNVMIIQECILGDGLT